MPLSRLAALHGVATSFSPSPGRTVAASDAAVVAVLAALGVAAATPGAVRTALTARETELRERLLPPTLVSWSGAPTAAGSDHGPGARESASGADEDERAPGEIRPAPGENQSEADEGAQAGQGPAAPPGFPGDSSLAAALAALPAGTRLRIRTEQGETRASAEQLPLGVHELEATAPDGRTARAHLVVAPTRLPAAPGRTYGLLVQVYSLLSRRSWGMGDLGDLAELTAWAGRALGAGFVQVNPMHAAVPGAPTDPSPYRPSSRRYPDPVYLRVEDVPEFAYAGERDRDRVRTLLERAERQRESVLSKGALIDRDAVWELKREALELVRDVPLGPGRRAAYCDFLAEEGEALEDHATWCALAEVYGSDWQKWPAALRDPRSAETARARGELMDRVDFHSRLAWLTDAQLATAQRSARDAGMGVGLVHDLAVGVHPGGADAWAQQEYFAAGMSVGAPPDAFSVQGQDWGLPPWRPDRLAESGYAPTAASCAPSSATPAPSVSTTSWASSASGGSRRAARPPRERMSDMTPRPCSRSSRWRRTAPGHW